MTKGKSLHGLNLPERQKPGKTSFDLKPRALEAWVRDLPMGNIGETARLVFGALHEVNRLQLSWADRCRFLEAMRAPVNFVQSALKKRYSDLAFPLPPKARKIALLAQRLCGEMALGYKIAAFDMVNGSLLKRDNRVLTVILHRAIRYLSGILIIAYQIYGTHPKGIWIELHTLYVFAEARKIHQKRVKDEENAQVPESSIARVYKQILLLALASPHRLRKGEAEKAYAALARWAAHADILRADAPGAASAPYIVHTDTDDEPDRRAFDCRDCADEHCRVVDTSRLSRIIVQESEHRERQQGKNSDLPADLLRRLNLAWGVAPQREASRSDRTATIEGVIGMTALHRALGIECGHALLNPKRSRYESKTLAAAGQPDDSGDVWNVLGGAKSAPGPKWGASLDFMPKREEPPPPAPEPQATLKAHAWQVRNQSAGGYRLALENDQAAKLQVGELLGLREERNGPWAAGVIRWIRQLKEDELECGVQVISHRARPVTVRHRRQRVKGEEPQRALLLPEAGAVNEPAGLIVPVMVFAEGDMVIVGNEGDTMDAVLTAPAEATGSFVRFGFSLPRPGPGRAAPSRNSVKDTGDGLEDEFDNIWSEL